jgi:hypothetical protein
MLRMHRNCIWTRNYVGSLKHFPLFRFEIPTAIEHVEQIKIRQKQSYQNKIFDKNKICFYTIRTFTSSALTQRFPRAVFASEQSKRNQYFLLPTSSISQFHVRHLSEQVGDANLWTRVFLWMSESTPVSYAQDFLLFVHNSSSLPWWATIILTTMFVRTSVTFPLAVYQVC